METITSNQLEEIAKDDEQLKNQLQTDFYGFLVILALIKNNKSMTLKEIRDYLSENFSDQINTHLKKAYESKNNERAEEQWLRKLQVKASSHWNENTNEFLRKVVDRDESSVPYKYELSKSSQYFCFEFMKNGQKAAAGDSVNKSEPMGLGAEFKIFYGPPGTGKTNKVKKDFLSKIPESNYHIVQIHPSFSYEDLVEGIKPVTFFNGEIKYEVVNGPVKVMSHKALKAPVQILCCLDKNGNLHLPLGTQSKYMFKVSHIFRSGEAFEKSKTYEVLNDMVKDFEKNEAAKDTYIKLSFVDKSWGTGSYAVILDEINRGHVASILGELVFALSEAQSEDPKGVRLQFSSESFEWPKNLSLFATMNTADTTTDRLDQAIKRRFKMIKVNPFKSELEWHQNVSFDSLKKISAGCTIKDAFVKIFEDEAPLFYPWKLLDEINDKIISEGKKYGAVCADEKLIGHSYFIKYSRLVVDHYLFNKTLVKKDYMIHARKVLRCILVEEVFPALENIFNFNKDKATEFIEDHILQAGAFNTLEGDVELLHRKYEEEIESAA